MLGFRPLRRMHKGRDPFPFLKSLERPLINKHKQITQNSAFKSPYPVAKFLINSSLVAFLAWQLLPYRVMFKNFQLSEYTLQKGYVHSLFLSHLSHKDLVYVLPNVAAYYLFGRRLEVKYGGRKLFYLWVASNFAGLAAVLVMDKVLPYINKGETEFVVPKSMGTVPVMALLAASLYTNPGYAFNPFNLPRKMKNEILMIPSLAIVAFYFMVEYYSWKQGYVEYICKG